MNTNTMLANKLIKNLHKVSQPWTSHLFRDNAWENVHKFIEELENVDGVKELYYGGGRYHKQDSNAFKEYKLEIITNYGITLRGEIRCHFAGTMDNPYSAYDMTVNFWKESNKNNKINENMKKIKLNESDLHDIIKESVKKVLSELDWRTYRNAAQKSRRLAYDDADLSTGEKKFHNARANAFDKAEDDAFMKKHKMSKYDAMDADHTYNAPLSQHRANAEYQRHVRGGDEYKDGAWRKKQ